MDFAVIIVIMCKCGSRSRTITADWKGEQVAQQDTPTCRRTYAHEQLGQKEGGRVMGRVRMKVLCKAFLGHLSPLSWSTWQSHTHH